MPAPSLQTAYARSPRMVGRRVGGEFILVPLAGRGADIDSVFNLTTVAAFLWERLDGKATGVELVQAVLEAFDVEEARARADYLTLVEDLLGIGALVAAGP